MKKLIYPIVICILFASCSKITPEICCTVVDIHVDIRYINEKGENILDQPDGIKSSEIRIFNKIDNEYVPYFDGRMDYSKGYMIYEQDGENHLRLFPNGDISDDNFLETQIHYTGFEPDTIKSQIDLSNRNMICTKIWLNENLVWENKSERTIQIIK